MSVKVNELAKLLSNRSPVLALSGAGISTDSGIPAYRDKQGNWVQPQPVKAAEFKSSRAVRLRYWRRSMSGWPRIRQAEPNNAHHYVASLQKSGIISAVITQNVDGLHQYAGSDNVIELHGSLASVVCLQCGHKIPRSKLQTQLEHRNPAFKSEPAVVGADGDATPTDNNLPDTDFQLIDCHECGGILKPDVVFFGENVPKTRVTSCMDALEHAGVLLCLGSSLSVLSGFRFCREAVKQGKPVCVINQGTTRADDIATIKIDANCADTLQALIQALSK